MGRRRLRTFIAIPIEPRYRGQLAKLQGNLPPEGLNLVTAENLHLTLLFLGEVDERELLDLCRAVASAVKEVPAFDMQLQGVGAFPTPRRPRFVWAGVGEGAEDVVRLHAAVERPLFEQHGYRREARAFSPHVTLGRLKADDDSAEQQELAGAIQQLAKWRGGRARVREVQVMGSELRPDGPEYSVLSTAKLAPARRKAKTAKARDEEE